MVVGTQQASRGSNLQQQPGTRHGLEKRLGAAWPSGEPRDYSFEEPVMNCLYPMQDSDMDVRPLCVRQEPSSSSPAPSRGLLVAVACQCPVWAVAGRLCAEQTLVPVTCHSGVTSHLPP